MRAAFAVSLVASLALCGPAFGATTVSVKFANYVVIADEAGERNSLVITQRGTNVTVEEERTAQLVAGEGCTQTGERSVECGVETLLEIRAALAGGGDRADVVTEGPACDCVLMLGGPGEDALSGSEGADNLLGQKGEDFLAGEGGKDRLSGGFGPDTLGDGDNPETGIGPDTLIGGRDVDAVFSYLLRTESVRVDLVGRSRNDGERGERDMVVNVEIVEGGSADDLLIGDGDGNSLYGWDGLDRLEGRGGPDGLYDYDANANGLSGGQGHDILTVTVRGTGPISCGPGRDTIVQARRGRDDPAPENAPRGPTVSDSCEAIGDQTVGFALDPVPDKPVSERSITFDRPRGRRHDPDFHLALTGVDGPPFEEFGRGQSTRAGVTVRLPADVAQRARRDGFDFRADVTNPKNLRRDLIWRFRQNPAR